MTFILKLSYLVGTIKDIRDKQGENGKKGSVKRKIEVL